ncbi:MAG: flagellar biosynthesis protein FlhF [Proteobacteria bacterium]|nr:flagellar biosynthesis protein FlhF [Pseudomonadota bacterium]
MNLKRFVGRTSREAMVLVRQAYGDDAVILSTKPCAGGVEMLAMAPETVVALERAGMEPAVEPTVADAGAGADAATLAMSTLSFQDYVRERMLKRRQANLQSGEQAHPTVLPTESRKQTSPGAAGRAGAGQPVGLDQAGTGIGGVPGPVAGLDAAALARTPMPPGRSPTPVDVVLDDAPAERFEMMNELRSMKNLIEDRFGALAFIGALQRSPGLARLTQQLLGCGFSPALIRKLVTDMPGDVNNEEDWAAGVLERNLCTDSAEPALEDQGGVFAMIGATGVGKTTSTAKLAAACAAKHGAASLGLITLDAYRLGAHEQLRAYGRILGVPVHMAHDRSALEDLLGLLAAKKMVIIDTAGLAQRASRTRELLDMLGHRSINKLLVINAAAQGETTEDVMLSYRASICRGAVLSKIDEAVKLGPALDALIRHRTRVVAVANGQRVPEDWHRLSSQALVRWALRYVDGGSPYRLDTAEVSLMFAAPQAVSRAASL